MEDDSTTNPVHKDTGASRTDLNESNTTHTDGLDGIFSTRGTIKNMAGAVG